MSSDRREFIGMLGAALASWVLSGRADASPQAGPPSCYVPPREPDGPGPRGKDPHWETLRQCWLSLKDPRMQALEEKEFQKDLKTRHDDTLRALVAAAAVKQDVADEMGTAFGQAVAHIRRQLATCYIALPPEYAPRHDLMQQAEMLARMAAESKVAPETVQKAEEAIQRDIEWLNQWVKEQKPGNLDTVTPSPAAVEAARTLVNLLLNR